MAAQTLRHFQIASKQPAHFGRVYAAYGGVFIVIAAANDGFGVQIQLLPEPEEPD